MFYMYLLWLFQLPYTPMVCAPRKCNAKTNNGGYYTDGPSFVQRKGGALELRKRLARSSAAEDVAEKTTKIGKMNACMFGTNACLV